MKSLILLTLFSFNIYAQKAEVLEKISKLDDALKTNPLYEACEKEIEGVTGDQDSKLADCFEQQLESIDDKQIEELGEALEVSTFGVKDVKNAKSIREFLTHRLRKGLHGNNYDEKTDTFKDNKKNLVGHDKYYELYKSQLSKSIIMEVNRYCLENLRSTDVEDNEKITANNSSEVIYLRSPAPESLKIDSYNETASEAAIKTELANAIKTNQWTEQPFVYTLLSAFDQTKLTSTKAKKNSKTIGQYANIYNTEKEVELNSQSPDKAKYFSKKEAMCIKAINIMCGCYTYKCDQSNSNIGKIACNVKAKIRKSRAKFEVVEEGIKSMDEISKKSQGFLADGKKSKFYSGKGNGESSIDEITNITSTEISQNVEGFGEDEIAKAKDTLEECKAGSDGNVNCEALFGEDAKELRKNDIVRLEADKAAGLKKIKELEDDDLKQYLTDNGYKDLLKEYEKNPNPSLIRDIIAKKYEAEKNSIIEEMNKKLKLASFSFGQKQKPTNGSQPTTNTNIDDPFTPKTSDEVVEEEKTKLEIKRDRFADVLHYSNVVSSYLSITDSDGKDLGKNTQALKQEYDEYQNSNQTEDSAYWKNLEKDANAPIENTDSASSAIDIGMIDRILGNDNSEKEIDKKTK